MLFYLFLQAKAFMVDFFFLQKVIPEKPEKPGKAANEGMGYHSKLTLWSSKSSYCNYKAQFIFLFWCMDSKGIPLIWGFLKTISVLCTLIACTCVLHQTRITPREISRTWVRTLPERLEPTYPNGVQGIPWGSMIFFKKIWNF